MPMDNCRSTSRLGHLLVVALVLSLATPSLAAATSLTARQKATVGRIDALQRRITDLEDTSRAVATHLEVSRTRLASLRVSLDNAEQAYERQQSAFDQRLVDIYKNGSGFTIALLTEADDFNEFWVRMRLLATIADADQRTLVNLRDQKITVAQAKEHMEEIESEQSQLLILQKSQAVQHKKDLALQRRLLKRISARIRVLVAARQRALAAARRAALRPNKGIGKTIRSILATVDQYPGVSFLTAYDNPRRYTAAGAKQTGIASWYGGNDGFNGRPTASGEMFNDLDFTAAHRTLPFGTYLAVRYQSKAVIVRITDRGPFIAGRVLDLSRRAAYELGISGLGTVETEVVSPK